VKSRKGRFDVNMDIDFMMNDHVRRCREELTSAGYEELTTSDAVEDVLKENGTSLVMVNSVCGCAGGVARPAAQYITNYDKKPDRFVSVFAGQDKEATDTARGYFTGYPPSSPSFALVK